MRRGLKCPNCSAVVNEDDGVGSAIWEARMHSYDEGWNACIREASKLLRSLTHMKNSELGLRLAVDTLEDMFKENSKIFSFKKQEGRSP